ncbi:MAG: hypothetical protein AB1Z98_08955 [Nannocystaceae bacterium]
MLGEEHILWDVVEEHLDEAEFLVEQWCSARSSASYTLEELRDGPEARLLAHVDAMVTNGPAALQRVAWPVIDSSDEPTAIAAAALAVLDSGDFRVLDASLEDAPGQEPDDDDALDEDDDLPPELELEAQRFLAHAAATGPDQDSDDDEAAGAEVVPLPVGPQADTPAASPRSQGLSLALALASHPELDDQVRARLAKAQGSTLRLLLQACADRGLDAGPALERGLMHDDPAIVVAAVRAAAFGSRHHLLAPVETLLRHPTLQVRQDALDTALSWGSDAAWTVVTHAYAQPHGRRAMVWAATLGDDRHAQALVELLDDEARRPDALWALGLSGRVPAVVACLPWLDCDDETIRRLAGEAVTTIVGLDLEDESLWEEPKGDQSEDEPGIDGDEPDDDDDDLDADLVERPEDDLPLPNAEAIRAWWAQHEGAFVPGQRYLLGKPIGKQGPSAILDQLSCRQLDSLAREMVARSQGVRPWPMRALAGSHLHAVDELVKLGARATVMRDR